MLRYEDIKDIYDGRFYGPDDEVLVGTGGCAGCSHCCESDMGTSIVLTPYDVYNISKETGKSFDDLLVGFIVEMSVIDGIVLPHLKMDEGCKFLVDGRCSIHSSRPGICRLFPLGRLYEDGDFKYVLQVNECIVNPRTPVKVRDWLGEENLEKNSLFINKWHKFIKFEEKKVGEIREMTGYENERLKNLDEKSLEEYAGIVGDSELWEEQGAEEYRKNKMDSHTEESELRIKEIIKTVLGYFYLDAYDYYEDFYPQFDTRLKKCLGAIRKI